MPYNISAVQLLPGQPSPSAPQQWVSSCNRRPRGKRHYNLAVVIKRTTQPFVKLKDCAWSALKGKEVKILSFLWAENKPVVEVWLVTRKKTVTRLLSRSRKYAHVTTLSGLVIRVDLAACDLLRSLQRRRNNRSSFSQQWWCWHKLRKYIVQKEASQRKDCVLSV